MAVWPELHSCWSKMFNTIELSQKSIGILILNAILFYSYKKIRNFTESSPLKLISLAANLLNLNLDVWRFSWTYPFLPARSASDFYCSRFFWTYSKRLLLTAMYTFCLIFQEPLFPVTLLISSTIGRSSFSKEHGLWLPVPHFSGNKFLRTFHPSTRNFQGNFFTKLLTKVFFLLY